MRSEMRVQRRSGTSVEARRFTTLTAALTETHKSGPRVGRPRTLASAQLSSPSSSSNKSIKTLIAESGAKCCPLLLLSSPLLSLGCTERTKIPVSRYISTSSIKWLPCQSGSSLNLSPLSRLTPSAHMCTLFHNALRCIFILMAINRWFF